MITHSIIKKSELESAHRLDAEYYQPEYFIDFSKGDWQFIGENLEKCQYGLSLAMNDEKVGYPIYKMDDIDHGFLFEDNIRYVKSPDKDAELYFIKRNDVFFNRVNSEEFVGRTGIFKDGPESVFASYLIRLRTKQNGAINSDYLNIFLNSKYGKRQISKYTRRAVNQANVNAEELKQMRIKVLPQKEQQKISDLSNESWKEFQKSKSFYFQAENLLLEELGLTNSKSENELWSVVNLSEVREVHRIDPDFFDPKYTKLFKILGKKSIHLSDLAQHATKRVNIQSTQEYNYIEISDIDAGNGETSSNKITGKDLPANAKIKITGGELLVSKVRPTRGAVAIVPDNWSKNFIASGAFSVFNLEFPMRECVQVVLRSFIGKLQLEKPTTGTSYPTVTDEDVENILIPILSKPSQEKIAELVQKSHESRKKAKELLEEAKRKVEELIENNQK